MIVRELGAYLAKHQRVSRQELARHFHCSEDAIDAMMQVWVRKGRVRFISSQSCAGGCCDQRSPACYEWLPEGEIAVSPR
ncbi:FeoC-like transcriptional regulator [Dongshaea marina]|uniref:FeoC-like transcriptional regulator n=1 Tax=Dongshaea marina TaxID=2047966 RepID=UPI000D3E22D9|nr:FeoC-like transcriptional regulator [Dongshaea marina]